jgi:hypothetical protein
MLLETAEFSFSTTRTRAGDCPQAWKAAHRTSTVVKDGVRGGFRLNLLVALQVLDDGLGGRQRQRGHRDNSNSPAWLPGKSRHILNVII